MPIDDLGVAPGGLLGNYEVSVNGAVIGRVGDPCKLVPTVAGAACYGYAAGRDAVRPNVADAIEAN